MESHLQHTEGRHYADQEMLADHNEDEHVDEKKSMMQKVKDKAKKIKNAITKHGHGDDNDDDDDDDDDEDETAEDPQVHGAPNAMTQPRSNLDRPSVIADDPYTKPLASHDVPPITKHGHGHDDEHQHNVRDENVEDPKVHGAPKYDSDAILTQPRGNLERPSVIAEDPYKKPVASHGLPQTDPAGADGTNLSGRSGLLGGQQHQVYGQEDLNPEISTQPRGNLERPSVIAEDPYKKPAASHGLPQTDPAGADGTNLSGQSGLLGGQQHQVYGQEDVNPEISTQPRGNMERPSVIAEDPYTVPVDGHGPPLTIPSGADGTNLSGQSGLLGGQHQESYGQDDVNPEKFASKIGQPTTGMEEEVPFAPRVLSPVTEHTSGTNNASDPFENHGQDGTHGVGESTGMMKAPHSPSGLGSGLDSAHDQDGTHGVGESTGMMKAPHSPSGLGSGLDSAHDQDGTYGVGESTGMMKAPHSPSGLGSGLDSAHDETKFTNPSHTGGKEGGVSQMQDSFDKMGIHDSGSDQKRFDPEQPENLPHDTLAGKQPNQSSSYMEKISSTASAILEKAGVAGSGQKSFDPEHTENSPRDAEKISSTDSAIPEKAPVAGSVRTRFDPEHPDNLPRRPFAGNQPTQNSSYTEKISSTASTIAAKAAGAKDVMASKLGYSGEQPTTAEPRENVKSSGSTATDYAYMISDKVTETLGPVYGKVVDAGSSVMSKVQGTVYGTGSPGTADQQMHGTETVKGMDQGDEGKAHDIHSGNQERSEKKYGEDTPMGGMTE